MDAIDKNIAEAAQSEIFSDKFLRYKRNIIILCILLTALHIFPDNINFDKLNFFGIEYIGLNKRTIILKTMWLMLIYNFIYALIFGYRDWNNWQTSTTDHWNTNIDNKYEYFFPELRMYFGLKPISQETINRRLKDPDVFAKWSEISWDKMKRKYTIFFLKRDRETHSLGFSVERSIVYSVRRNIFVSMFLEVLLPSAFVAIALISLGIEVFC